MNKIQFLKSLIGLFWYYKLGTIFPIVGDFAAYKASGTSATLTKNSDNLTISVSSAQGWMYNTTPVDLTNIKKIWVYGSVNHATTVMRVSIDASYTTTSYATASASLHNNSADAWVAVDVSALTGNHYIRIGRFDSAQTVSARAYQIYGEA